MSGEATVGGIVGYLRLDRSDWDREMDAAGRKADELGRKSPDVRVTTNAARVAAELEGVGHAADKAKAPTIGLWAAVAAIAPAAVPIGAVATGAFLGLAASGAVALLGIKGISEEFKSGALNGTKYGADIKALQGEFSTLKKTAASGLLSGLDTAMTGMQPMFKALNGDVGTMAGQLGRIVGDVAPALVTILTELNPLFVTLGTLVEHGAKSFANWANNSGGVQSFVAYIQAQLPSVMHTLGELVQTFGHLMRAAAPLGQALVSGIGMLAGLLNAIPIGVLQVLIPLVLASYAAFKTYAGITFIVAAVNKAIASNVAAQARMTAASVSGAAAQRAASAATAATVAQEAAVVAQAKAAEARAFAVTTAAMTASAAETSSLFAGEAAAAVGAEAEMAAAFAGMDSMFATEAATVAASAESVAVSLEAEAAAAVAASNAISAAAARAAAASAEAGAAASAGWSAMLGPIGAVVVGVGILAMTLRHSGSAAKDAAEAANSYSQSVQESTSALSSANVASTNKTLSDKGALTTLAALSAKNKDLGVSQMDLALAVNGSGQQYDKVTAKLKDYVGGLEEANAAGVGNYDDEIKKGKSLINTLGIQRKGLQDQILTQTQLNQLNAASLKISDKQAVTNAAMYGLHKDSGVASYLAATQAAKASADAARQQAVAFKMADDAAGLLKNALDRLSGKQMSSAQAQNTFDQALVSMVKHTTAADGALSGMSQSAIQNRGDLINLASQAETAAGAYGTMRHSTEAGRQKLIDLRAEIIHNAVANGENKKAVEAYLDKIMKIPPKATTTGVLETTAAEDKAAAYKRTLAGIAATKKTVLSVIAAGAISQAARLRALVDGLHDKTVTLRTVQAQSLLNRSNVEVKPAGGGLIRGPGTGTSDSIPAMVSDGEYVIKASQTAKHRALLDAINQGVGGYANGGLVTLNPKKGKKAGSASKVKTKAKAPGIDVLSTTAGGGTASGVAQILRGAIPEARIASRELSRAVEDAFVLKGITTKLNAAKADLKSLVAASADMHKTVTSNLSGTIDPSKYGDVGGLLGALGDQTGVNKTFTSEIGKLGGMHLNAALLKQLAEGGPSAGLDTLAGASKTEIAQINKSYAAYKASADQGGRTAATSEYGAAIAKDRLQVSHLTTQQAHQVKAIDKLVAQIAKLTHRPAEIRLDGKVLAKAMFTSKEFTGVLDSITHQLTYGRH